MKALLFWLLLFAVPRPAMAQVPRPGIYRVSKRVDYRPAAEFNYGVKSFTAPRHHPFVAGLGVRYCLVAVDSAEQDLKTRLVFLTPSAAPTPALAFEGGFQAAADSTFNVYYSDKDAFGDPPGNALRFFGTSFLLHDNVLTHDSGAGDSARAYVANNPGRRLTVSPRNSLFALQQARPYRTLLLVELDQAPYYAAPDTARRGPMRVAAGQYVAILRETPTWYEAETVSPKGIRHQGWLWKPDLEKRVWVTQTAQTPDFRFQVAYRDTADEALNDLRSTALAIRVISRQTGRVQQLIDSVGQDRCWSSYRENISVLDCNFDGYPDLMLFAHDGGAGPNSGYLFYLYDPGTGQFVFHEGLSDLTQTRVNPQTKTISAGVRDGCCAHASEEYAFLKGQLTLVASFEIRLWEGYSIETEGKLVNGKWREKTRKLRDDAPSPKAKRSPAKNRKRTR